MILVYKCEKCSSTFKLSFKACDRGDLNMHNPNLKEDCPKCNYKNNVKINDIKAIISPHNKYIYGIALAFVIILGVLFINFSNFQFKNTNTPWQYYAVILFFVIPFLIANVFIRNDVKAVQLFNRYYI